MRNKKGETRYARTQSQKFLYLLDLASEPLVLGGVAGGADVEAGLVHLAGQRPAAVGLVRAQHDRMHQSEGEAAAWGTRSQGSPSWLWHSQHCAAVMARCTMACTRPKEKLRDACTCPPQVDAASSHYCCCGSIQSDSHGLRPAVTWTTRNISCGVCSPRHAGIQSSRGSSMVRLPDADTMRTCSSGGSSSQTPGTASASATAPRRRPPCYGSCSRQTQGETWHMVAPQAVGGASRCCCLV